MNGPELILPGGTRMPGWRSGKFYGSDAVGGPLPTNSQGNFTLAADRIYDMPIRFPAGVRLDRAVIDVNLSGGAGKVLRLMLFDELADGSPGALIADFGELAADSVAVMAATIDLSASCTRRSGATARRASGHLACRGCSSTAMRRATGRERAGSITR